MAVSSWWGWKLNRCSGHEARHHISARLALMGWRVPAELLRFSLCSKIKDVRFFASGWWCQRRRLQHDASRDRLKTSRQEAGVPLCQSPLHLGRCGKVLLLPPLGLPSSMVFLLVSSSVAAWENIALSLLLSLGYFQVTPWASKEKEF